MAIAYFIPDQNKLLARSATPTMPHNNAPSGESPQQSAAPMPAQAPQQQQNRSGNNNSADINNNNNNFRANITIPLPPYSSSAAQSVGCWELITQVFCYALRFYHESRLNPSLIQISFEFSGGFSATATTTTTPPTASSPTTAATNSSPAQSADATTSATTMQRPPAAPKRN